MSDLKWWQKPVRMMRQDYVSDLQRMKETDLAELARVKKEEWHVNCEWVIGTPGIAPGLGYQTTFNTPLFEKYPALGDWDLIREYLPHAQRQGIHVLAYLNLHWFSFEFAAHHPDWVQRLSDGRSYGEVNPLYGTGTTFCVNSPWREWSFRLIADAMGTGIDGVFLDGPVIFPGCCYCDYCRAKYRAATGRDLPPREDWTDSNWKAFIEFRETSMAEYLRDARAALREVNPDGVIFLNAGSWHGGGWRVARNIERCGPFQEFNGAEAFFHPGPDRFTFMWAATAKHLMAGGKPAVVFSHHCLGAWHYIPLPPVEAQLSYAQSVACGANPWFAIFDYALDHAREESIAPIREIGGFLEKHEEYYTATESAADVALLFSSQASTYYVSHRAEIYRDTGSGREQDLVMDQGSGKLVIDWTKRKAVCDDLQGSSFQGCYAILTQEHIPFDVILDTHLTLEALSRYRVVILPNAACLSDAQAAALRAYVAAGGSLVASFETGLYDQRGEPRTRPGLQELLGLQTIEGAWQPRVAEEYIRVTERHPAVDAFGLRQLLPRPPLALRVKAQPGTACPAVFLAETGKVYAALGPDSPYPALVLGQPGGRVAYFPMLVESTYAKLKMEPHRRLVAGAVRWAHGGRLPLTSDAPPTVQIELRRQPGRLLVHLVNNTGDMQRPITRLIPIHDIRVTLAGAPPRRLYRLTNGEELPFTTGDGTINFTLPLLGLYEVVVAEA
ncbi:MAG: beta-galactosidase trimerization domain-containing protein [Armatimonadota bacterium]|nr:beta-galactosidase trimerization domain-containing protein [Armatimonadota bacterium]